MKGFPVKDLLWICQRRKYKKIWESQSGRYTPYSPQPAPCSSQTGLNSGDFNANTKVQEQRAEEIAQTDQKSDLVMKGKAEAGFLVPHWAEEDSESDIAYPGSIYQAVFTSIHLLI